MSSTTSIPNSIELEDNYHFVKESSVSILKILDYIKEDFTPKEIQQIFNLKDQEVTDIEAFLKANERVIEQQYQEEIRRFYQNLLFHLEGNYRLPWKNRIGDLVMLIFGIILLYVGTTAQGSTGDRIATVLAGIVLFLLGFLNAYIGFQTVYRFQSSSMNIKTGVPYRSFLLSYPSIARISISPPSDRSRVLSIQDVNGKWYMIITTPSMEKSIKAFLENGQYEFGLHYTTLGEAQAVNAIKARRHKQD